jgi:acetylornithine deacetylase
MTTGAGDSDRLGREAVDLTRQLIALNTVNPALAPGAPGETVAVQLLAGRLSGAGFAVEVVAAPGKPGRPSLLATSRGRGGGPSLVLNGHLDTVGTGGMVEPFTARIEGDAHDGRLVGRGACDMKAGVAAMVVCAERAAAQGTEGDVVLALVADEEHGSVGTEAVLAHLTARGALPDACIVGEPTWLELAVAHRGFAVIDVRLRGRAAHSSRPLDGSNAVTHLGRLLSAVERADIELSAPEQHPYAGHGSLVATVCRGGEAPFSLAATAVALVERRTVPGESAADAVREVEALLASLQAEDPAVDGRCVEVLAREAWQARMDDPLTTRLLDLFTEGFVATGRPAPGFVGAPYWMESALWDSAGVSTVVCGPAGGGLHGDDEWVDLGQVRSYAAALDHVIAGFCGRPA